jgi:hypothetical protein
MGTVPFSGDAVDVEKGTVPFSSLRAGQGTTGPSSLSRSLSTFPAFRSMYPPVVYTKKASPRASARSGRASASDLRSGR